jgi:glycosyltransferase involved in cell wall biosynthesis
MKLSVSMIVKNESSCLEKCLNTVKEADEIVIVDTGSEDNTIDIAKKFTDKVYSGEEYLWRDDFAFHRNQSLNLCTGDWILIIDADEYLEPNGIEKIRNLLKSVKKDTVYFKIIASNNDNIIHNSIRLFKNNKKTFWKGRVHNYLNTADAEDSDIKLYYSYSEAHKKDPDRALRILSKVVKEEPNCVREKYYLAREYKYRSDWKKAIYYYDYYLETASWAPEMAEAWLMKSYCYNNLGKNDKAKDCALQAIKINADFQEAFVFMSNLSGPKNQKKWLEYSKLCNNEDVLFIRI